MQQTWADINMSSIADEGTTYENHSSSANDLGSVMDSFDCPRADQQLLTIVCSSYGSHSARCKVPDFKINSSLFSNVSRLAIGGYV